VLSDGATLPADLVVFATGYGNMVEWAAKLISPQGRRQGRLFSHRVWGQTPWEGELRNMWKPTAQPGLWFHGGNLMQSRHYSLYLALQLKARMERVAMLGSGVPIWNVTDPAKLQAL
jgi:putative flavoprotein involved in K+ transport